MIFVLLYWKRKPNTLSKRSNKEANQMRKDGMLTSVWSLDGKIYVKTSPDGAPKRIQSHEDLDNVWL